MALFFSRQKPRQFNYKPLYFDPEKEAREKRREELLGYRQKEDEEYVPGTIIRSSMNARQRDNDMVRRARKGKTTRTVIIVLALLAAVAWIMFF